MGRDKIGWIYLVGTYFFFGFFFTAARPTRPNLHALEFSIRIDGYNKPIEKETGGQIIMTYDIRAEYSHSLATGAAA